MILTFLKLLQVSFKEIKIFLQDKAAWIFAEASLHKAEVNEQGKIQTTKSCGKR